MTQENTTTIYLTGAWQYAGVLEVAAVILPDGGARTNNTPYGIIRVARQGYSLDPIKAQHIVARKIHKKIAKFKEQIARLEREVTCLERTDMAIRRIVTAADGSQEFMPDSPKPLTFMDFNQQNK